MQNILFLSAILYFFFSIFYIKKFKPPVRFKKILLLIMILNVIAFALFFWLNQHLYAAIGTVLLLTAALAVFNKVKLPPVPLKVRIYFKFLFAILLVFFFAIISIPENTKGRRYYDSARYFKQGFDISGKDRTGASPPIYPIFLNLVGENNAVVWQSIISVISWCVIGYAIGRMPGLITAGVFSVSPWFSHWNGLLLTESLSFSLVTLGVAFSVLLARNSKWIVPWFICSLLAAFTREGNLLLIFPFFAWPAFFRKGAVRYIILTGVILIAITSVFFLALVGSRNLGQITRRSFSHHYGIKQAKNPESYKLAWKYLTDEESRPFRQDKLITKNYHFYFGALSKYSQYLKWLKISKFNCWVFLLFLPIIDLINLKRIRILSALIIVLFLISYTQSFMFTIRSGIVRNAEIWRHMAICDYLYVFSLGAALKNLSQKIK